MADISERRPIIRQFQLLAGFFVPEPLHFGVMQRRGRVRRVAQLIVKIAGKAGSRGVVQIPETGHDAGSAGRSELARQTDDPFPFRHHALARSACA